LPVTFYRNDNQLPDFMDYSMKNRTYRYMTEKPLFPFGYGLSYTTFSMTNGKVIGKIGNNAKLNVTVRNTGAKEGTAVVEMYIRSLDDHGGPIKTLRGFKRVNLKKGETKNVTIDLTKDTFERFDTNTNTVHFVRGNYEILYGTSSDAADLKSIKIKI
jgi:beta-glucosidase